MPEELRRPKRDEAVEGFMYDFNFPRMEIQSYVHNQDKYIDALEEKLEDGRASLTAKIAEVEMTLSEEKGDLCKVSGDSYFVCRGRIWALERCLKILRGE